MDEFRKLTEEKIMRRSASQLDQANKELEGLVRIGHEHVY